MRFISLSSVVFLAVVALACAYGNLHVTRARSLVPGGYYARVVSKERRTEKHPGLDDVVLWKLNDGRTIQVAAEIDEIVPTGFWFTKGAGEFRVATWDPARVGDEMPSPDRLYRISLTNTKDDSGMFFVAGPVLLSTALLAWAAIRRRRREPVA